MNRINFSVHENVREKLPSERKTIKNCEKFAKLVAAIEFES